MFDDIQKLKGEIGTDYGDFKGLYGDEELKLLAFPLITLIKTYILYPGGKFKRDQIKNLKAYLEAL